jgi:uncharacterized protein (TIGR03437 family)
MSVNAASYLAGPLARGSLASAFGNNLSATMERSQASPAPTKLAGVTIKVTDSAKVTHDAQLVYVDAKQINYVIPEVAALGKAEVVIMNDDNAIATGDVEISDSSPALFAAGSGESKLAVGMTGASGNNGVSTVNPDGSARGIRPGSPFSPNTLTLLGTGLRFATDVQVRIGDKVVTPVYVGPQADAPGVDRVEFNVPVTATSGMNTISLVTSSKSSATTQSSAATLSSATTQSASDAQSTSTTLVSNGVQALVLGDAPPSPFTLSPDDVKLILAQTVAKAQQSNLPITAAVLDTEGNVLGIFKMNGARSDVTLGSTDLRNGQPFRPLPPTGPDPDGLEQFKVPVAPGLGILSDGAALAAISKAGTAAFFSTQGSAISTRTASSIVLENFPVGISSQPGGPLFGVQFSQLPCSDVRNLQQRNLGNLPFGLSADPGGVPIYKNGVAVGGLGVEGDGFYSADLVIMDNRGQERSTEENIAMAGIKGFRVAKGLQIDNVLIDGMRLEYSNVPLAELDGPAALPFDSLVGTAGSVLSPIRGQQFSGFSPLTLGGVPGRVTQGFFPFQDSAVSSLTSADVNRIITQAAQQAYRMRAAIRIGPPGGVAQPTEVNISVVDTSGRVLGLFSTQDAPQFGFDVCVQKARTAVFFSLPNTEAQLRAANANILGLNIGKYADAARMFGVPLNGQNAFTSRAMGFLARPFFPDGIPGTPNGPFSKPLAIWSPFNDGLQIALVKPALAAILTGGTPPNIGCSPLPNDLTLANGLQIFAGSSALFKNGVLVGAVGVSGDGIDQDDGAGGAGAFGYEAPAAVRADQLLPLGVRLPYIKYPRHINIGNPPTVPPIIRTSRVFANTN